MLANRINVICILSFVAAALWLFECADGSAARQGVHYFTGSNGSVFTYNSSNGDIWYTTWADDGKIYTICDDCSAFGGSSANFAINSITGFTSGATGTQVNAMASWGAAQASGSDSATYKATGIISVSGTLYAMISRQVYNSSTPPFKQTAANAQLIKSTNHGVSWTPTPPSTAQPYSSPMFPAASYAKFATGAFIQYGQDYQGNTVDNSGTYVYAISNDGFWNNGNQLYLGRVLISAIGNLSATDWSFYQGGDGSQSGAWGSISTAASLINSPLHLGWPAIQYVPALGLYVMYEWFYPAVAAPALSFDPTTTAWDLYTAPHPWGPWTFVQETSQNPSGFYNPSPVSKSVSGNTFTVFVAGNFNDATTSGSYNLHMIPVTLN